MKIDMTSQRRSGILAHISSLPSPFGIGDIGPASYDFLEYLASAGQSCWQFLPLNPTNPIFDNSPYMSTAAFAGSPLLISPELLYEDGLIAHTSLAPPSGFSPYTTHYKEVARFKGDLLREAFTTFATAQNDDYRAFCSNHQWLRDYGLFMALKQHYGDMGWYDWPDEAAGRQPQHLAELREKLQQQIDYFIFEQFIFHGQWARLKQKAEKLDILLFGDIPIYVGLDSVDVWANQDIFTLDPSSRMPSLVSGVPPDYFSETGQRWGNPLYRWDTASPKVAEQLLTWWAQRFSEIFELVHIARIDHFRAFESYWAIPAENEDAIVGAWLKGPGTPFFKKIETQLGHLHIIAEDLGIITPEVAALRDELKYPGMKVLQFAFDGSPDNPFLPHNYTSPNCVVYTGTHDNDTTMGWFLSERVTDDDRNRIKCAANRQMHDTSPIHHDMTYLALSSISNLAILPLQDIFGFGSDCRMNTPGVPEGNWRWRCAPEFLTKEHAARLRELSERFNRLPKRHNEDLENEDCEEKK